MLIGLNGNGKTNLIEGVHLLSYGKSFRGAQSEDLCLWGEKQASLFATISSAAGEHRLGIVLDHGKKAFFKNDKETKFLNGFFGSFQCITFTPFDLLLIKGGPQERRRFLDKHAVDLMHALAGDLNELGIAVRSKRALLVSQSANDSTLDPWDRLIAKYSTSITAQRQRLVSALLPLAQQYYMQIAANDGLLEFHLKSSVISNDSILSEEEIVQKCYKERERERRQKSVLVGSHRDDLVFSIAGANARDFASQGQTRAIVLALKLAALQLLTERLNEAPVILLDDVDSELDRGRAARFYELLFTLSQQVFITTTDLRSDTPFAQKNANVISVDRPAPRA